MVPEYQPDPLGVPESLEDLTAYIQRELTRLSNAIAETQPKLEVLSVEPERKKEGLLVSADGENWNPGSGKGLYVWLAGKWNLVNIIPQLPDVVEPPLPGEEPLPDPVDDPDVLAAGRAVATFNCIGIYWKPPKTIVPPGAPCEYKRVVDSVWKTAHPLWYDGRNLECRGSIVGLDPNTEYDVRFGVPGEGNIYGLRITTWSETFPEESVTRLPAGTVTTPQVITQGGSAAAGYAVYTRALAAPTTIDVGITEIRREPVRIDANYVIVRDLICKGGQSGILVMPGRHHVVIENNDISEFGRYGNKLSGEGWKIGRNEDAGVRCGTWNDPVTVALSRQTTNIVIQRNTIHDPAYGSNSWQDGHPSGPVGVYFKNSGGQNVVRYNEIFSNFGSRWFQDGIMGSENFSTDGSPGPDSDIYGNSVTHCWDDAIEAEGGGRNVRIWGNYTDRIGGSGVAVTPVHQGPTYVWRNVLNRHKHFSRTSYDSDPRGKAIKAQIVSGWSGGAIYFYHNTILQWDGASVGANRPLGFGEGLAGDGMRNVTSKNNIWQVWTPTSCSIRVGSDPSNAQNNDMNYDLRNGKLCGTYTGAEANIGNIVRTPVYKTGHGPEFMGKWQLDPGSAGHDQGEVIPNFSDGFLGVAPDVGAHEEGTSDMVFGITS